MQRYLFLILKKSYIKKSQIFRCKHFYYFIQTVQNKQLSKLNCGENSSFRRRVEMDDDLTRTSSFRPVAFSRWCIASSLHAGVVAELRWDQVWPSALASDLGRQVSGDSSCGANPLVVRFRQALRSAWGLGWGIGFCSRDVIWRWLWAIPIQEEALQGMGSFF